MRKLHVVGFTTDFDGLIFSTRKGSKSGSFVVAISDELLDKLAEVDRLRNGGQATATSSSDRASREEREAGRTRPQSELTPREIQARLRAGRTIDEVANEARCPVEWVERFAAPIIAEQASVIELARTLTYSKPRLGESALSLGNSVALNLIEKGSPLTEDEFDANWSAFQLHDGIWMVRFRYRSRGRSLQASWELDVAAGRLTSRDRVASDLAYVDGARKRRATEELEPPTESPDADGASSRATVRAAGVARRPAAGKTAPVTGAASKRATTARRRTAPVAGRAAKRSSTRASTRTRPAKSRAAGPTAPTARAVRPRKAQTPVAAKRSRTSSDTSAVPATRRVARATAKRVAGSGARATAKRAGTAGRPPRKAAAPKPPASPATAGAKAAGAKATRAKATAKRALAAPRPRRGAGATSAEPTTPVTSTASKASAAKASARKLARAANGPKFGTDGSRPVTVGSGSGGRRPTTPAVPGVPPTRAGAAKRATASGAPAGPARRTGSSPRRAATGGNGMKPAPGRVSPPPRSRASGSSSERRSRDRVPSERPAPRATPPVRRSPPAASAPSRGHVSERGTPAAAPPDAPARRPSIFGDARPRLDDEPSGTGAPISPGPPERDAGDDDIDRRPGGDEDAFVIRPRISAKQASELAFSEERPRRFRARPQDPIGRSTLFPFAHE